MAGICTLYADTVRHLPPSFLLAYRSNLVKSLILLPNVWFSHAHVMHFCPVRNEDRFA